MRFRSIFALLTFVAAQPALAQPAPPPLAVTQQEPPARVGAVSYVSGNLAFHTAGDTQWSAAGVNYPVATGGSFWTDPAARAVIQIGPSTIGMDSGSELDVTSLNEQVAQFGLPQGRIHLHLRHLDAGQSFEIDLPQGAVWLLQPGSYDITAGSANQGARIAVFAGAARFVGGNADIGVKSGDAVVLSQTSPLAISTERAGSDAFVAWCTAHDYHADHLASPYYVSAQMTGYSDLDTYGQWRSSPQYGEVWYPSQTPANWAPYRDGRWVWVAPWGWTWVDQQPWGFAPFHYGRWAYADDRWGWVPGSYVAQPVYAPALVAFVGLAAGIGASLALAGPAVGWFPLAPGEAYWPSYTNNTAYIRNVNISNVKNINTVIVNNNGAPPAQAVTANFANRQFATVVPQRVFANADPVAPAIVHVAPATLEKAPVAVHPPAITPAVAHAPVQGPPRTLPAVVPPGINHVLPTATGGPGQPPHPGETAPHPANTAALPPLHPGQTAPHPPATSDALPPTHPGAAPNTAALPPTHPGAASNTAALPPAHPGETGPHPPATPAALPPTHPGTAPNTAALPPPHPGETAPHPLTSPATLPPAHPGAAPVIAAPPSPLHPGIAPPPPAHPPTEAQVIHPPAVHPPPPIHSAAPAMAVPQPAPAPAHPTPPHPVAPVVERAPPPAFHPAPLPPHPVAPVVERPAPPAFHPAPPPPHPVAPPPPHPAAPVVERLAAPAFHPAPPPPHPAAPAPAHPQAAQGGGKPGAKEKGKEGEGH